MKLLNIHNGMSLRAAIAAAKDLKFEVGRPHASGEVIVTYRSPDRIKRLAINARRKDAPRALIALLAKGRTLRGAIA